MDRQGLELFLTLAGIVVFLLGGILAWLVLPWLSREQLIVAIAVAALALTVHRLDSRRTSSARGLGTRTPFAWLSSAAGNYILTRLGAKNTFHIFTTRHYYDL